MKEPVFIKVKNRYGSRPYQSQRTTFRPFAANGMYRGREIWKFLIALVLSIVIITLLMISCTVRTVKRVEPKITRKELNLLQRLKSFNSAVRSLEAKALAVYRDNERTYSLRVYIATDKETAQLRLDISDFVFKIPLTTVLQKGDEIVLVNYSNKTVSTLRYGELNFSELIGIEIPEEVLVRAVIGEVFIIANTGITTDSEIPTLFIKKGEENQTVIFSPELIPVQVQYKFNEESITIQFEKFELVENVYFPKKISIQDINRKLDINYSDLRVNIPVAEGVFLLDKEKIAGFSRLH